MSPTSGFKPLTLDELFALVLPEPEWAIEGLLPLGHAALLTAREKAGKGLLGIDLCASITFGEPFLDRAVKEGPAIYCAAEERIRDVRDRIAARLGDRRDAPLYVLPLDGSTGDRLKLDDPESMQRLFDMVMEIQPVLMVLDTLRELHDRQEDSSDEMGPLLRSVRQLAHQTNTAVVVNHHQNRGGTFRGSTAIRAAFDLEWAFARSDDADGASPRGTLRIEGRHGPRQTLHVQLADGLRWVPASAPPIGAEAGVRERIIAHLDASGEWQNAQEIADALAVNLKTVQNVLSRLVKERPCPIAFGPGGKKNAPRAYRSRTPDLWALDEVGVGAPIVPPDGAHLGARRGGNNSARVGPVGPGSSGNDGGTWERTSPAARAAARPWSSADHPTALFRATPSPTTPARGRGGSGGRGPNAKPPGLGRPVEPPRGDPRRSRLTRGVGGGRRPRAPTRSPCRGRRADR